MGNIRRSGIELLDYKIEKAQEVVSRTKAAYDKATEELKELLDKRDAARSQELVKAIAKSNRSYEEVLEFLDTGA